MITPAEAKQAAPSAMTTAAEQLCDGTLQNKYLGTGTIAVTMYGTTKKSCLEIQPLYQAGGWTVALSQDEALNWVMSFTDPLNP